MGLSWMAAVYGSLDRTWNAKSVRWPSLSSSVHVPWVLILCFQSVLPAFAPPSISLGSLLANMPLCCCPSDARLCHTPQYALVKNSIGKAAVKRRQMTGVPSCFRLHWRGSSICGADLALADANGSRCAVGCSFLFWCVGSTTSSSRLPLSMRCPFGGQVIAEDTNKQRKNSTQEKRHGREHKTLGQPPRNTLCPASPILHTLRTAHCLWFVFSSQRCLHQLLWSKLLLSTLLSALHVSFSVSSFKHRQRLRDHCADTPPDKALNTAMTPLAGGPST